jgi:hypothetical protein
MSFTLTLKTPITMHATQRFVADLTPNPKRRTDLQAIGWRRSIRDVGGFWMGEFDLQGPIVSLARYFYEYLGYHLEEQVGGHTTWEGILYEMELFSGGSVKRRSLDTLYNSVRTYWKDDSDVVQETTVAEDDESIRRYGKREEYLYQDDGSTQESAESYRDAYLAEYGWPWARTVGLDPRGVEDRLKVQACGYAFTGNWEFLTAGDGSIGSIAEYYKEILAEHCPFLRAGNILDDGIDILKQPKIVQRAWDGMINYLKLGDVDNSPRRAYVDAGRRFHYEPIRTRPEYFWREGELYASPGSRAAIHPRLVRPGVVRDLSYPVKKTEIGAWLQDARDAYIQEVEVLSDGKLVLKTDLYEEVEIQAAQENYKAMLEKELSDASAAG